MGLPLRLRKVLHTGRTTKCVTQPLVVTAMTLAEIDLMQTNVLIWAGSGPSGPPLGPNQLICPATDDAHRLVVIDFRDHHHPLLRRWSRRRRDRYRDAGWFSPGADPHVERIKEFLANRPGGTG